MPELAIVRLGEPILREIAAPVGDDDGILFVDRVEDARMLTTWEGFERHHAAADAAEARALVERFGSQFGKETRMWTLAELVDLERYPIHDVDGPGGTRLVERVRGTLREVGACDLPGFLLPEAVTAEVVGTLAARADAFRTEQTHDIEFSGRDPESLAQDDPLRVRVRSAKDGIAYDRVPADSPVRALYQTDELTRFVGRVLELEPLYRSDDALGALNLMLYAPGDELGWHFDNADFVVTLMLQAPEAGGTFEYVPMLRSEGDRNDDGVRALLDGRLPGVRTMSGEPGTLALFRGHWSPHRVTPVEGDRVRVNAVLSYARAPGHRLQPETYRLFYGRTPEDA